MSRGFVGVVFCSFGSRLAVNSGLEPGHFLSQDCHLEKKKLLWKIFQKCFLPPSFDERELHSPPQHPSSGRHSPSPRKPPSEQSGFPSASEPLATCSQLFTTSQKWPKCIFSPPCCNRVLGSWLPVLAVLLLRGDKLLGSLPDYWLGAQLLHVKGTRTGVKVGARNGRKGKVLPILTWVKRFVFKEKCFDLVK